MSILDGKPGGPRKPSPPAKRESPDWERMGIDLTKLGTELRERNAEVERLTGDLKEERAKLEAAAKDNTRLQTELADARARAAEKQTQLEQQLRAAQSETARIEALRAAEAATSSALREQLATRNEEPVADDGRMAAIERDVQVIPQLMEAIAKVGASVTALASRPAPKVEPPTYEMQVTGRDGNNRPTTIRLRPAKE